MTTRLYGGIEAGGTKFVCAAARDVNEIVTETLIPATTPARTLRDVEEFFDAVATKLGPFDAFGIASFGPVDLNRASPTCDARDVDFAGICVKKPQRIRSCFRSEVQLRSR
jgi:predicted NBD/HSP70 family sugar kinase